LPPTHTRSARLGRGAFLSLSRLYRHLKRESWPPCQSQERLFRTPLSPWLASRPLPLLYASGGGSRGGSLFLDLTVDDAKPPKMPLADARKFVEGRAPPPRHVSPSFHTQHSPLRPLHYPISPRLTTASPLHFHRPQDPRRGPHQPPGAPRTTRPLRRPRASTLRRPLSSSSSSSMGGGVESAASPRHLPQDPHLRRTHLRHRACRGGGPGRRRPFR
jgi:hypothetical protein